MPDLPRNAAEYETWFFTATNAISQAGLDPDLALSWAYEVDEPNVTIDDFLDRGSEASLDQKLLTALIKAATGKNEAKHAKLMTKELHGNIDTALRGAASVA